LPKFQLIFEKQWLHALLLAALLVALVQVGRIDSFHAGQLWGISTTVWFWTTAALAVVHQVFVWFCWRTQLHASLLTRTLGHRGFTVYAVAFSILGVARAVVIFFLAISSRDTFHMAPTTLKFLALILAIPTAYLFYSVKRYFGFRRAFGIDHFDESYRSLPLVRKGIFRFTRNGMYIFGFLILWLPGLWYASTTALCVALFNHLYIWVHYYSTELPDMKRIYGETRRAIGDSGPA
jgi:protein-S-isoprenylcysteine O-methyltransferase Ste14